MLTCRHCGAELHEDQKVCIQCGKRTIRGDGFDWDEKRFQVTKNMKIGAGIVGFVLLVIVLVIALRVTPPDQVAREWVEALSKVDVKHANTMVTDKFLQNCEATQFGVRDMAGETKERIVDYRMAPTFSPVSMNPDGTAVVKVTLTGPDSQVNRTITMVRQGRRWMVDAFN